MNCDHIRPLLSSYLDGELDPAQQAQVIAHLTTCQECNRVLDDFRALGHKVRALPDVPAPGGMQSEFRARLERGPRLVSGPSLLPRVLPTVIFVAALVALALGLPVVLRQMQSLAPQKAEVIDTYPLDGTAGVPLDANLVLTFTLPMEHSSVEAAVRITPETQLAFAWEGDVLTLVPLSNWRPATTYTLTVASTAREVDGASLGKLFVLRFETATDGELPAGSLTPIGRFGQVWRDELGGPESLLGHATAVDQELWCAGQRFEKGLMIWVDQLREDRIYVLIYGVNENSGVWQQYVDTWREGDPESGGLAPPAGLFEPIRGFGRLWREELGGADAPVGWALTPEQGYVGNLQPFEHGVMLWNPLDGAVYVLWEDGNWTAYHTSR